MKTLELTDEEYRQLQLLLSSYKSMLEAKLTDEEAPKLIEAIDNINDRLINAS